MRKGFLEIRETHNDGEVEEEEKKSKEVVEGVGCGGGGGEESLTQRHGVDHGFVSRHMETERAVLCSITGGGAVDS